jgi:hyperosmotically inducible protein
MLKQLALLASTVGMLLSVACAQSDSGITTAVKAKFATDDTVKAYQINVDTNKHVVTLSGTIETNAAKQRAVLLARETKGVENVIDNLTVNRESAATAGALREEAEARGATDRAKELGLEAEAKGEDAAHKVAEVVTDGAITSAVKTQFLADPGVHGLKIDVDTKDGIVTLNGMVKTRDESNRAMFLAHDTKGVKSVVNNLRIGG